MTDRREAITTLTEHLDHWKRLLSEGVCTKEEGERTINALNFAIESIKVDRAYDLAYEKVDFIEIPEGATIGDVVEAVFPNIEPKVVEYTDYIGNMEIHGREVVLEDGICIDEKRWNSPYRKDITTEQGLSYADGDTLQSAT